MNEEKTSFWKKDSVRSVIASLLSILIGLLAGTLLILIVGCTNKSLGFQSAWEGIRLVFFGLFSTGRDATGALTFGFNPASMGNMLFRAMPLIVAVQPTRGLDVGAIEYIHRQLVHERDEGKAVLLVSLELDEVMNLSDRILVMYEGEIVGEFDPKKVSVEELGLYMAGAKRQDTEGKK